MINIHAFRAWASMLSSIFTHYQSGTYGVADINVRTIFADIYRD